MQALIERTHLAILRRVDQKGTLVDAARELCVTQSALSQSIKKLEHLAGVPLWSKAGRNVRLTEAGRYLLNLAERILPQLETADRILEKFAEGTRGFLRIGMECHPCYRWLLTKIGPFLKEWPAVDVDVQRQFAFRGVAALYRSEIDVLVTPDPLLREGLIFHPVFGYEQVLVLPRDHPLSDKAYVKPRDLEGETLLTYPVERERLDIFRDFLTPASVLPRRHKTVEDTDILLQMVASGRGITALPQWLIQEANCTSNLSTLSLGREGIRKNIHLGVRDEGYQPRYLKAFLHSAGADIPQENREIQ